LCHGISGPGERLCNEQRWVTHAAAGWLRSGSWHMAPGAAVTAAAILLTESASAVVLQSRALTSPESAASR